MLKNLQTQKAGGKNRSDTMIIYLAGEDVGQ